MDQAHEEKSNGLFDLGYNPTTAEEAFDREKMGMVLFTRHLQSV